MQFISERARRAAESKVIDALIAIMGHAGWSSDPGAQDVLASSFRDYFYIPSAELLLIPTLIRPPQGVIGDLVREARSDALCVAVGRRTNGAVQVYANICEWSSEGERWSEQLMAWVDQAHRLWFVPDPAVHDESQPSFRIGRGRLVRVTQRPDGDHSEGLERARTLFAGLEGC